MCEVCTLGSYANSSAMTECLLCFDADGGGEWTTSRVAQGEDRWIEVEGASDASFCHCRSGWFLHNGECRQCSAGTICAGSGQLELLPGYFSNAEDPGYVFKCDNVGICPGGMPGSCADGRDASSVACSACLPGFRPSRETCIPCSGSDLEIHLDALKGGPWPTGGVVLATLWGLAPLNPKPLKVTTPSLPCWVWRSRVAQDFFMSGACTKQGWVSLGVAFECLEFRRFLVILTFTTPKRPYKTL